jgi:hypothetical protein
MFGFLNDSFRYNEESSGEANMRIPLKGDALMFARTPPNNVRRCSCSLKMFAMNRGRNENTVPYTGQPLRRSIKMENRTIPMQSEIVFAQRKRSATAYHEAGHAVVAITLGYPVRSMTIAPNNCQDGSIDFASPLEGGLCKERLQQERSRMEDAALIALSGPIAQQRYCCNSFLQDGETDHELAIWLSLAIGGGSRLIADFFLRYAFALAASLVDSDWNLIEHFAKALLSETRLNAVQILRIVSTSRNQDSRQMPFPLIRSPAAAAEEKHR